ncbi:hypothetical protein C8R45DRAFT_1101755 [Mycena sanguinolenta]|nr:hypothetical protein C8R45DRAFT_1101755 [Mycena sanguinolenta]
MSTKRCRSEVTPTPPSSTTHKSSVDINTTSKFIECYHFEFDTIPTDKPPVIKTHLFWVTMNSDAGYDLLKFAFRILNPDFELSKPDVASTVEDTLPAFRYAMSRINPVLPVPPDVGCALAGVGKVVDTAGDEADGEWGSLSLPDLPEDFTPYSVKFRPSTPEEYPSQAAIDKAPTLFVENPYYAPPLKHSCKSSPPTKSKASKEGKSGLSHDLTQLGTPPPADSVSSGHASRRNKSSAQKGTAKAEPDYEKSHPDVRLLLELQPLIEAKMFELVVQNGMGVGTISLPANSIIATITLTQKQPGTILKAKSHLGDVDGHRLNKRSETMTVELIDHLDIEPFCQLDISEAVQPLISCFICRLLELTCYPHGVGIACRNCQRDKHGFLCDHAMRTPRFTALLYEFVQRTSEFLLNMPITIHCLQDTVALVRCTWTTQLQAQQELAFMLHPFFEVFCHQMHIFGETGFQKLLSGIQMDKPLVDVFNSLIHAFNRAQHFDNDGLTNTDAVGSSFLLPSQSRTASRRRRANAHIPEPPYKKASTFSAPSLGHRITMSSGNVTSPPAPKFEPPAFMELDSTAGIFKQIDMADTICAALIPVLAEAHVLHCAQSKDFNNKISAFENKTRQYTHNMATNLETCNLPAPDSFKPFSILYDRFRDVRRGVVKERTNQSKALADQEKAEKAKAKAEAEAEKAAKPPPLLKPRKPSEEMKARQDLLRQLRDAYNRQQAENKGPKSFKKSSPKSTQSEPSVSKDKGKGVEAPKRARSESVGPSDVSSSSEDESDVDMPAAQSIATRNTKCIRCSSLGHVPKEFPDRDGRTIYDTGANLAILGTPPAKKVKGTPEKAHQMPQRNREHPIRTSPRLAQ